MAAGTVQTFVDRLDGLGVGTTFVTPSTCSSAIAATIDPPAVGVPLPFPGVSMPDNVEIEPGPDELERAATGVTPGSLGIAEYGTVLLEVTPDEAEAISLFGRTHLIVLNASDIVADIRAGLEWFGPRARDGDASVIFATGPSATADMGALVEGAHGPERVHVLVLEDTNEGAGKAATGHGSTDATPASPSPPGGGK